MCCQVRICSVVVVVKVKPHIGVTEVSCWLCYLRSMYVCVCGGGVHDVGASGCRGWHQAVFLSHSFTLFFRDTVFPEPPRDARISLSLPSHAGDTARCHPHTGSCCGSELMASCPYSKHSIHGSLQPWVLFSTLSSFLGNLGHVWRLSKPYCWKANYFLKGQLVSSLQRRLFEYYHVSQYIPSS